MTRLQDRYKRRSSGLMILVFLYSIYLFADWVIHDRDHAWLLSPILLMSAFSLGFAIFYWRPRVARIQDSDFYLRGYKQNPRRIRSFLRSSPNALEIRFNPLYILVLRGEQREVDRFAAELIRLLEASR